MDMKEQDIKTYDSMMRMVTEMREQIKHYQNVVEDLTTETMVMRHRQKILQDMNDNANKPNMYMMCFLNILLFLNLVGLVFVLFR